MTKYKPYEVCRNCTQVYNCRRKIFAAVMQNSGFVSMIILAIRYFWLRMDTNRTCNQWNPQDVRYYLRKGDHESMRRRDRP